MPPIEDHPLRYALANELHARPFPSLSTPSMAAFLAIKQPTDAVARDRGEDLAHLVALLDRHGAAHPQPGATHYSAQIGRHWLKWEQHTEFVTYTAFCEGVGDRPFDPAEFGVFPDDWLGRAPGQRLTSALVRVCAAQSDDQIARDLGDWFVPESTVASDVLDGAATVASDFRIDPAGHMRMAVFTRPEAGQRRVGRTVQRLMEIETYKTMSLLGFTRARSLSDRIGQLDTRLTEVMVEMTEGDQPADKILPDLLAISSELETMAARSAFRFGATGAYRVIVGERIIALREARFKGRPTFAEFMVRRFDPAMRTVTSTEKRLETLAARSIRAGDLLRTRVDVERSAQNQALLESMDRRADMALRLQHTVEGLSVVAISYYAVSLVSYLLYPLSDATGLSKGMIMAMVTLPVVVLVWLAIRRIRKSLH
ncbi:MAG: hypothetical protein CML66_05405 [Rhodobacteraceae bacterium]|nr:hypothetical protein [Paracoccaceae bacterium]MAY45146.1 hypothetical protein [Paracoccaceae bacterium]